MPHALAENEVFRHALRDGDLQLFADDLLEVAKRCWLLWPREDGPHLLGGTPKLDGSWPRRGRAPLLHLVSFDLDAARVAANGELDGLFAGLPKGERLSLFLQHPDDPNPDFKGRDPDGWRARLDAELDVAVEDRDAAGPLETLPGVRVGLVEDWSFDMRGFTRLMAEFDPDPVVAAQMAHRFLTTFHGTPNRHHVGGFPLPVSAQVEQHADELHGPAERDLLFQFSTTEGASAQLWGEHTRLYWLLPAGGAAADVALVVQRYV